MALAAGVKIPADRIETLYFKDGKDIFPQNSWWTYLPFIKRFHHLKKALYDSKVLETLLYREFGDRLLGEASTRIIIPAFMAPKTEIAVFKTDHHPDYKNDHKAKVWEVARSTSAAPTYLKGYTSKDAIFLDGGIWANNPIMLAVIEALSAYDIAKEQIEVLSIGTGNLPFNITLKHAGKGLWQWKQIIKAAMFLTTDNAHAQATLLLGPEQITRLEPTEKASAIELDDWQSAVSILPAMAKKHFDERREEIAAFIQCEVEKRHRFYTTE